MRKPESIYNVDSPEIQSLLLGVYRSGAQTYHRIDPDGKHYVVPIRRQLMGLGMCSKTASRLLKEAGLPYAEFIHNEPPEPEKPEPDPQAVILAAIATAAKEAEREEKRAKAARAEEAAVRKRYSLVRQGSYHGVYNEETGTQVLFHSIEEAREHINDLIHGRDAFNSFYGGKFHHKPRELQAAD